MAASFLTSDLDTLFASSDFGEADGSITWNGVIITSGHFDDEDVEVQMGEGIAEIVNQPLYTGPSSQFPGIADNDTMIIRGETFKVKNWKDDATGVIEIFLERQ